MQTAQTKWRKTALCVRGGHTRSLGSIERERGGTRPVRHVVGVWCRLEWPERRHATGPGSERRSGGGRRMTTAQRCERRRAVAPGPRPLRSAVLLSVRLRGPHRVVWRHRESLDTCAKWCQPDAAKRLPRGDVGGEPPAFSRDDRLTHQGKLISAVRWEARKRAVRAKGEHSLRTAISGSINTGNCISQLSYQDATPPLVVVAPVLPSSPPCRDAPPTKFAPPPKMGEANPMSASDATVCPSPVLDMPEPVTS